MESKVMIMLCTAELARRADFYDSFLTFDKPKNSIITLAHGQSPARNRNVGIQNALDTDCTHIFFIDDDVVLPADTLTRLLAHGKDIVSGLYLMRNHPHLPIAFDHADTDGKCRHIVLSNYKDSFIEIVSTGLGCLLVKTDVFRKLEKPWIRMGELESDMWCDDLGFYFRARKAGYTGWLDTTVLVGHQASLTVWPIMQNGEFKIGYDTASKEKIVL